MDQGVEGFLAVHLVISIIISIGRQEYLIFPPFLFVFIAVVSCLYCFQQVINCLSQT